MRIFAAIQRGSERAVSAIYYSGDDLAAALFCPDNQIKYIADFTIAGGTYSERKQALIMRAIYIKSALADSIVDQGTLRDVMSILERYGRRYGCLREFRENGIC